MLNQLRIAHKLWLAVAFIVVMLIAVVVFSGYRSAKVQVQADAAAKAMGARVSSAIRWAGLTETNAARTQALIVSSDPAVELEFKDVIAATSAQISELKTMANGGRGLMLIDLEPKDQLAGAVAYTRSIRIEGVGRGGKLREETLEIRSLNNARAARGRKGKAADLGFKPASVTRVE